MGINVEKARGLIGAYRVWLGTTTTPPPYYSPTAVLDIIERVVEALAESEGRACSLCGAHEDEPHYHSISKEKMAEIRAKFEARKERDKPTETQFEVGDIVRCQYRTDPTRDQRICRVCGTGDRIYLDSAEGERFSVEYNSYIYTLTHLFPTHLIPKELGGYKVGDVVELIDGRVGMITSIDSNITLFCFNILVWYPDKGFVNFHRSKADIVKKLWPAEKP